MKYNVTLNSKVYEVEVERGEAILVNVAAVSAAPAPVAAAAVAAPASPVAAAASNVAGDVIKAPMPGTILAVKVNVGDNVKSGQSLVVLEAMKMENDILAPRDGRVAQILVAKGSTVETGAPLVALA
ncbi:MAG: acetyl-CoA carboxylase biotin carboxyl carrier protein subunit [Planctomycetota bacterium]|jgi:glutaconyl-CoA decarboxylase|nr:acetyl-CoA carboxylase biotin carboxyl carrier protein subunit [Planctomycetota bacterium]